MIQLPGPLPASIRKHFTDLGAMEWFRSRSSVTQPVKLANI